jgi:type I restriction enzyme S subunit
VTRLKILATNPVERPSVRAVMPFYALEQIESGTGRLMMDTEIQPKDDDTAVIHRAGDVRFGKLRPYLAKSLLMTDHGCGSGELLVLRPRGGVDSRYLHYLTLSKPFVEWATATSYGVKMPRTNWESLGGFNCDTPKLEDQRRIADVLDVETTRIDELIGEQADLKALLAERLRASRELLLLGPDGTGLPGWDYSRLKRFVHVARGRFTHRPRNDPALYDGRYSFIQTGDIAAARSGVVQSWSQTLNERGLAASRLAPAGTLVMAIAANIGDVARLGFDACFPDSVVAISPRSHLTSEYLLELVRALRQELVSSSTLNTQLNINVDRIGDIQVPIPPPQEQTRLLDELNRMASEAEMIGNEVDYQVGLLREHRQALITAAVTGGLGALHEVA